MYHIFPIHSSVEGYLGCFQVLAMTNSAALNMLSTCPCGIIEHPLGIYPKVVLLGLDVDCFLIFWEIAILIFKETVPVCTRTSNEGVFPHPLQHKFSSVVLILAILTDVNWNLRVVLICISLMARDVGHFLKCLSVILFLCWEFFV